MTKIADLKARLTLISDPETLMLHRHRNSFFEDQDGHITGLNLCESELTDDFLPVLNELPHLRALNLSGNNFTSVTLPLTLTALRWVDFSDCPELKSLQLPPQATDLTRLDTSDSKLETLLLPEALPQLEYLDVSRNQLTQLDLPVNCPQLSYLDAANNNIEQFAITGDYSALVHLYLPGNGMKELHISTTLPHLKTLNLSHNQLRLLPQDIILSPNLETLYAGNNRPKNIPDLFLGTDSAYNCLHDARIWFEEIRDFETEENRQVKLMITGNGDTGKSSLLCALKNGKCACPKGHDSTHGIQIDHLKIGDIQFNVWDFGGQEIYLGTHRLFMESPAIQLLVFDPKTEEQARAGERKKDRISDEMVLDHQIEYWYDTAKALSPHSPFIVVQNKSDSLTEEDDDIRKYAKSKGAKFLHLSARTGDEIKMLGLLLQQNAIDLPEYNMVMPASWLAVRKFFSDNLDAKEKSKKTIPKRDFDDLCAKHRVNERTKDLLRRYLHHGGFLYQHDNLGDTIIINQQWALTAIYKLLDRDAAHYKRMNAQKRGEISAYEMFDIFGSAYNDDEKKLFLQFMETCGICFKINTRESDRAFSLIDSYLFPAFLPDVLPEALERDWNSRTTAVQKLRYKLPYPNHPRLLSFITALGRKTEIKNIWRNGIQMQTPDGWFRIEMQYKNPPAFLLSIEQKAMHSWLKSVLEALNRWGNTEQGWEKWDDKKQYWEIFDAEKWMLKGTVEGAELQEKTAPAASITNMDDVPQKSIIQRVLVLSANPVSTARLSSAQEFSYLHERSDQLESDKCKLELHSLSEVTRPKMIDRIKTLKPHFIHFIGHGVEGKADNNYAEGLVFHSDGNVRETEILDSEQLKATFQDIKDRYKDIPLHTVYLNACLSSTQAVAISSAGLEVIGANDKIGSASARQIAGGFYKSYSESLTVTDALDKALEYAPECRDKFEVFCNGNRIPL